MRVRAPFAWPPVIGALSLLFIIAASRPSTARAADPTPQSASVVAIVAPPRSRLAEELRRELEAATFRVILVETTPLAWRRGLEHADAAVAVSIAAGDTELRVFKRNRDGEAREFLTRDLDGADRLARRRACLELVEELRLLGERASPPATAAPASVAAAQVASDAAVVAQPPSANLSNPGRPLRSWSLGVGTTMNVDSTGHAPTADVQLLWMFPLGERLALRARGSWPVLASSFAVADKTARILGFSAGVGVQYDLFSSSERLRPYVGGAVGSRLMIVETLWSEQPASRVTATPVVLIGAQAGVRYRISSGVRLFGELEAAKGWLAPDTDSRWSYEEAAADAASLNASIGVLFEY